MFASMFSPVNRSRVAKAFTAAPRVSTVMRAQRLGMGSATSYNTRVSGPRRQSRRQTRHPDRRTNSTLTCGPPVCQSPTLPPWPSAQRAHGGMGKSPLSCFTGKAVEVPDERSPAQTHDHIAIQRVEFWHRTRSATRSSISTRPSSRVASPKKASTPSCAKTRIFRNRP